MHIDRHPINVRTHAGGTQQVYLDYFPDECPVCHSIGEIKRDYAEGYMHPSTGQYAGRFVQVIYRCPRTTCGSHFIIQYEAYRNDRGNGYQEYYFRERTFPRIPKPLKISERVSALSPDFVRISNQANEADTHSLNEITGIGYRKALEFLIKDYCIHKKPDDKASIRSALLMACINDYVTDTNIKECARRATWLGNDETHYERRWNEHDIEDLKVLIDLTKNWIDNELLTEHYIETMTTRNTPKRGG